MTEEHGRDDDSLKSTARCKSNAAQALFAATAQIGLALRESQEPVAELGTVIAHIAEALAALRSTPVENASERATIQGLVDKLEADVFQGIQRLQFYDRMVQHLSHLQNYLISVANELGAKQAGHRSHDDTWEVLHAKLRARLISDEQRRLFDRFLHPDTAMKLSARVAPPELSTPGSMEFF
jgi:hypothetical protein